MLPRIPDPSLVRLHYYRCSQYPQSVDEGKSNEFNCKDLFTQHLRRIHAPYTIKKLIAKSDSKIQVDWDNHLKEMQASCLVTRCLITAAAKGLSQVGLSERV